MNLFKRRAGWLAGSLLGIFLFAHLAPAAPQIYTGVGVVQKLESDGKTVVIQHEAISNYMAAMTMPYEVHDPNLLHGLKPGDHITFRLVVTTNEGWIDGIVVRSHTALPQVPGFEISRAVEPLDEGQTLPDYAFTNELGQAVQLSQYKGQVFAFTFFFTSCPFPNYCPRIENNFSAVARQLAQATNEPTQWHLFSISFDPAIDQPAHLKDYAEMEHYDAAHWSFLTGAKDQISELADNVGETFTHENGTFSHNIRTVVINRHFRVDKIYVGNGWSPEELTAEMIKAAR